MKKVILLFLLSVFAAVLAPGSQSAYADDNQGYCEFDFAIAGNSTSIGAFRSEFEKEKIYQADGRCKALDFKSTEFYGNLTLNPKLDYFFFRCFRPKDILVTQVAKTSIDSGFTFMAMATVACTGTCKACYNKAAKEYWCVSDYPICSKKCP